ncbi:MAG: DUF4082 domain-containing protein [Planctomycetales bacterium]|nr:DUF4082 domain-containing protein [Planctomycetales bacterium]
MGRIYAAGLRLHGDTSNRRGLINVRVSLRSCRLWAAVMAVIVVVGGTASGVSHAATAIIDFAPAETPVGAGPALVAFSADSTIGWSFTPRVDLHLTELGFYDGGIGLGLRHAVGLWDASGQLLASSELGGNRATGRVVPPGEDATPWPRLHDGDYLFAAIEPIHLLAGETYVIGATVPLFAPDAPTVEGWASRGDGYRTTVAPDSLAVDADITIDEPALVWQGMLGLEQTYGPGELHRPTSIVTGGTFAGVNFRFSAVPEPSGGLIAAGLALGMLMCRSSCWRYNAPPL